MNIGKKRIICLLIIIILILSSLAIYLQFFKKSNKMINNDNETVYAESRLYQDFKNNKITTDEYVKYSIYLEYDQDKLPKEYSGYNTFKTSNLDDLMDEYYNDLSEDTINYYTEKIMLTGITFDLNKENTKTSNNTSSIISTVHAASKPTINLENVVLSSNNHFVIWYTTTGDSSIDEETAKKVAKDLENSVSKYDKLFNTKFSYKPSLFDNELQSKIRIESQKNVLNAYGIDEKYLEEAMQVYIVDYDSSSLAKYVHGYGALANSFKSLDDYGCVLYPYIIIKPSSFDDYEDLEQIYNHELFHHYQYNVLCGNDNCTINDKYASESMANLASSLITNKKTNEGFLNEWAGSNWIFSNSFFNLLEKNYGSTKASYALFVYLFNFYNQMNSNISILKEGMYSNDFLLYLQNNSTKEDRSKIQKNIAIKNLNYDYSNKNLNIDPSYRNNTINIQNRIILYDSSHDGTKFENEFKLPKTANLSLDRNGIYYFEINTSKDKTIEFTFNGSDETGFIILADENNKYKEIELNNNKVTGYDKYYYIVYNSSLINTNNYSVEIRDIEENKKSNNDKDTKTLKYDLCVSKEMSKKYVTHYLDDSGYTYKAIETTEFSSDSNNLVEEYYNTLKNDNTCKNVEMNNNKVECTYSDYKFQIFKNSDETELSKYYKSILNSCKSVSSKDYISYEDCNAEFDDEIELAVDTYYFVADTAYKQKRTVYYYNEDDAKYTYEFTLKYPDKYTNVKIIKNKIIQYEMTQSMFEKMHSADKSKSFFTNFYGSSCSLQCSDGDCKWLHSDNSTKSSFDPDNP